MSLRVAILVREILTGRVAASRVVTLEKWLDVYRYLPPAERGQGLPNLAFLQLMDILVTRTSQQGAITSANSVLVVVSMYTAAELDELTQRIWDIYEEETRYFQSTQSIAATAIPSMWQNTGREVNTAHD